MSLAAACKDEKKATAELLGQLAEKSSAQKVRAMRGQMVNAVVMKRQVDMKTPTDMKNTWARAPAISKKMAAPQVPSGIKTPLRRSSFAAPASPTLHGGVNAEASIVALLSPVSIRKGMAARNTSIRNTYMRRDAPTPAWGLLDTPGVSKQLVGPL